MILKPAWKSWHDVNIKDLGRHLQILQDDIKHGSPKVKKVTSVETICDIAHNEQGRQ